MKFPAIINRLHERMRKIVASVIVIPNKAKDQNTKSYNELPQDLHSRMKRYESYFTGKQTKEVFPNFPHRNVVVIPAGWPVGLDGYTTVPEGFYPVIRVDGHKFSTFTKQFDKPFDKRVTDAMIAATKAIVDNFQGIIGYTQSDEITLVLPKHSEMFGRQCQKLASLAASCAAVHFYDSLIKSGYGAGKSVVKMPEFDGRTFGIPDDSELANMFVWRERDAIRNAISAVARRFFSDKSLLGINSTEKLAKLSEKGVDFWTMYPSCCTRGAYFKRVEIDRNFKVEDLEKLPPKHHARTNPEEFFARHPTCTVVQEMNLPVISTIANLPDVLINNATPVRKDEAGNPLKSVDEA